jgi:flagellar biosynthesis protein FlhB
VQPSPHIDWVLALRGLRIRVRRVLPSSFPAPPTTKRKQQSNPPKLTTYPTQSHPSTQREKQLKKPPSRERKLLFACFVAVLVTWMSFASDARELRGGVLSMLETHIVMTSLISHLILTLIFHLAFTLGLRLVLLHMLFLSLLMDLTIAHMVLVHERTSLNLDALVMAHILIVVIVSRVGLVFLLESPTPTLSRNTWMVHVFLIVVHVPLDQMVRWKGL